MKIIVNTISTKKNAGGAYQIAYNFLMATLRIPLDDIQWFYITSYDVNEMVGDYFIDIEGSRYFIFPTQPDFKGSYHTVKKELAILEEQLKADLIYTISSPCYFSFKTPEVMRFANAWVTNPNKYAWASLPWKQKIRMWIYCINQRRLLKNANFIITQSETVKQGLLKITSLTKENIGVIPNVLPSVIASHHPLTLHSSDWIDVACIAAPVPHKNLNIIPKVLKILNEKYHISNVRFHVTIPPNHPTINKINHELAVLGLNMNVINHGRCTQEELFPIYEQCSICFLPTLLETFSATSLEAMHFGLSIIASDFGFNSEVIGNAGLYFRPMDAKDAALKLVTIIKSASLHDKLIDNGYKRLESYRNYKKHFMNTIEQLLDFHTYTSVKGSMKRL